jgi:hypothetical protein
MDLGRNARTKQSRSRLPAVMLTVAVVVATIAAIWFASTTGFVGGTATKPAAGRSDEQIEAQRSAILAQLGAKALPDNLSARRGYPIAAQTGAVTLPDNSPARHRIAARAAAAALRALPDNLSARRGYPIAAQTGAKALPDNLSSARRGYAAVAVTTPINLWSWRGHAAGVVKVPDNLSLRGGYWVQIAAPSFSATSGTFHLGR